MDNCNSVIRSPARAQWIAVVAVFGATWGAAEVSLGALLRTAAVPLHGLLMAGVGILIALVARRVLLTAGHRGRGAVLAIGFVAATLVPLSVSRGVIPAMIGILGEAACLEIALWLGRPTAGRFALAGLLAALIPLAQMVLWLAAQYGPAALTTFREILLVKQGGVRLGLAGQAAGTLLIVTMSVSAGCGLICGLLAWSLAGQILRRLGRGAV